MLKLRRKAKSCIAGPLRPQARCLPFNETVAVKKASLELMEADLSELIQEGQLMRRLRHPNVLTLHCAFVVGARA